MFGHVSKDVSCSLFLSVSRFKFPLLMEPKSPSDGKMLRPPCVPFLSFCFPRDLQVLLLLHLQRLHHSLLPLSCVLLFVCKYFARYGPWFVI